MESLTLAAQDRKEIGKGPVKRLRMKGLVPAIIYGGKEAHPRTIMINDHDFRKLMRGHSKQNVMMNLQLDDNGKVNDQTVLLKEMQVHPYKRQILHIDFLKVAMDELITVEVALHFAGEHPKGTNLEISLHNIEIEALPGQLPEAIDVDVEKMELDNPIMVSDLVMPAGVKVVGDLNRRVAVIVEQKEMVLEKPAEEAVAAAPEAAATEAKSEE
ncbi:MAG: 50S ribosomal protein L25 [Candidatus Schekmanbacteria bacterium]|nr:50S ribosomal protein L25 [Candidatus Schekmanbacteria bacterium]